jgi:hypothetical protein
MAIVDVPSALAQYNANLNWQGDPSSAALALQAIRFLLVNRFQRVGDQGAQFDYEKLESEKSALETFLGATTSRAFGRSRRVAAWLHSTGGIS